MVLDADALLLICNDPDLVRGYQEAVLTPNVVEFERLAKALNIEKEVAKEGKETDRVERLARELGGVMVLQKGGKDHLSNGTVTYSVDLEGGKKRSGGQGDTLTGSIATFLGWRKAYHEGLWDVKHKMKEEETAGLAVFGGSVITRVSAFFFFLFEDMKDILLLDEQALTKSHVGMLPPCLCQKRPQPSGQ